MKAKGYALPKMERDFLEKVNAFFQKVNAFFQKVNGFLQIVNGFFKKSVRPV